VLAIVAEDAEALGCTSQVAHARTILERGTSAHRQLAAFAEALAAGASEPEALRVVVDRLVEETLIGVPVG
jgi:carboxylate-amine ligase